MAPVAIVTDTCHYLPRQLVAARGIHEVSLYVHWDGREDRESQLPDFDGYYRHLAGTRPPCRRPRSRRSATSSPSGSRCSTTGREIVSIHLAGGISGTVGAAQQAREALGERAARVHVLDSVSACGGEGLVVLAAHAAAARGICAEEVVAHAREARAALKMWFAIDTLEFLRRGGRIGTAQAWLGSALKIKPILTLEAEITPVERVRTSGRAFDETGRLPPLAQGGGRRRLGDPAHPGARGVRADGRARARDIRHRPGLRLRGRAGDRDARRPWAARRRRNPAELSLLKLSD